MSKKEIVFYTMMTVFLLIVLYLGYWWIREDSTERNAQIQQDTFGRQNALVEQILDDVREVQDPDIPSNQRIAIINQICDSAAKLNGSIRLQPTTELFIMENC